MSSPLRLNVLVVSYKPIAALTPPMSKARRPGRRRRLHHDRGHGQADVLSSGLIRLLAFFAGIRLLFARRYPRGLYDFIVAMNRWVVRVIAYAALMTDAYPPFRLDQGGAVRAPAPDDLAPAAAASAPGPNPTAQLKDPPAASSGTCGVAHDRSPPQSARGTS
jgi:hypothetical protein